MSEFLARAATEYFESIQLALEFQDVKSLTRAFAGVRLLENGVRVATADAIARAQKWLRGHDLELSLGVLEAERERVRIEISAVWTSNKTFERHSAKFEFELRWRRRNLQSIELISVASFAPLPPGSQLGRRPRTWRRTIVFTVATHPHPCLSDLAESCRRQGISLEVIGKGAPWLGLCYAKVRLVYWYLSSHREDFDTALFTDGYDTVFTSSLDDILAKYRKAQAPILFSAECNCYPGGRGREADDYPSALTRYRFLNSGGWIAEVPAILDLLTTERAPMIRSQVCDQAWWTTLYLAGKGPIQLDHNCEIFQCLFRSTQDLKVKRSRIQNVLTGTQPAIIHANGCISLVPYSDHVLGRYHRRLASRFWAYAGQRFLDAMHFWKQRSPLLRALRKVAGLINA